MCFVGIFIEIVAISMNVGWDRGNPKQKRLRWTTIDLGTMTVQLAAVSEKNKIMRKGKWHLSRSDEMQIEGDMKTDQKSFGID